MSDERWQQLVDLDRLGAWMDEKGLGRGPFEHPAPLSDPDSVSAARTSGAEGIDVDKHGNVFGAEVRPKDLKKYVKK
jgi:hypothetical protein